MSQEPTPTVEPGQEPEPTPGQEPTADTTPRAEPKTFDEAYVKQLRKEAASSRAELGQVKTKLGEIEDRDKTEQQRLTERVAESERRAGAAEMRLARFEVMAEHKIDLEYADLLAGETPEALQANAVKLAQLLSERSKSPGGFDGGARKTPDATKSPEQAHNDLLLRAMGRVPDG